MKCAITGSTGVLGKNFIKKFPKIKFIKYQGNILNKKKLGNWILKNDFDYLLHFAAVVPTAIAKKNYNFVKKVNYEGTKNIVEKLLKKNKKVWLLFSSTSHIYNFSNKALSEKSTINPVSKYGLSKLLAEKIIKKKLKNSKIDYCIVRIFSFTDSSQNESYFVPGVFLNRIKYVNTLRDFIDIRDLCSAIYFLMKRRATNVFNLGSGKKINLNKIISVVQKRKINNMEKPKNNLVANINKIKSLGWKPKYNILYIIKNFKKNYN